MTLKEKFESIEFSFPADESVKIAEDFAVGFAKWNRRNQYIYELSTYSYKELLEIYKKEKGL